MVVIKHEGKTSLTIRGPETRASNAASPAGVEFFGITFKLGTYMPHLPIKKLLDRNDMSLPDAGSQSFWLHGSSWQFPTVENADTFVHKLVREGLVQYDPVIRDAVNGQQVGLSPRALQYRFLHATGLTHSTIQQINRAQQAISLLRQGKTIADVVFETGYFDQPHLTRALKRFAGQTPLQIQSE
jgi:AraC-like DNA-binding protein